MRCKGLLIGCLVLFAFISNGFADTVFLKNGDRLTGKVMQLENNKLVMETAFAGKVSIAWNQVSTLETDADLRLHLESQSVLVGKATAGPSGQVIIKTPEMAEIQAVSLARVLLINPPPPGPAVKLSGRMNAGMNVSDGNTQSKSVYLDGELVARSAMNRFTIGATYQNDEDEGEDTADNAFGYIKYDHFFLKKWYALATATGTKDDFADLNLRTDFGLGVGHQFWEEKRRNLSFELGVSYVNEDFINAEDDDFSAGRWAVNFDHLLWRSQIKFFHSHEGLVSIENTDDLIIRSRTGVRMPIYKGLNSTIEVKWDWDNSPAEGRENSDTDYIFSLGYSF